MHPASMHERGGGGLGGEGGSGVMGGAGQTNTEREREREREKEREKGDLTGTENKWKGLWNCLSLLSVRASSKG